MAVPAHSPNPRPVENWHRDQAGRPTDIAARHHPYSFVLYVEQEVKEDHLAGPIGDLVARAGSGWKGSAPCRSEHLTTDPYGIVLPVSGGRVTRVT